MISRADAADLDARDPIATARDLFHVPENLIYLDGNSLGLLPKTVQGRLATTVEEEWGEDLIGSWMINDWIGLPFRVGDKIGRLIGAGPGEVVVTDSTSVNLFKMLAAALQLTPGRSTIVTERTNFPTDVYIAQGLIELVGSNHSLRPVTADEIVGAIDEHTAVVYVTHVNYLTGRMHDMAAITAAAHEAGAVTLWDLSHSVGAAPVELDAVDADLAVGCGYKYLNGGPGAPAFLYVARRHQDSVRPALSGWMGHAAPFEFAWDYHPAAGVGRHLVGTPPVLSMVALDEAVAVFDAVAFSDLWKKSLEMTRLFMELLDQECDGYGLDVLTPREPSMRGSQVSVSHPDGYGIVRAMIARGVIGDFRSPDVMRFGFAPLYLRYTDVWDGVAEMRAVLEAEEWNQPEFKSRAVVT